LGVNGDDVAPLRSNWASALDRRPRQSHCEGLSYWGVVLARREKDSVRAMLRFTALGAGGDGIAEFEGRRVFAQGAAPGDVATADIRGDRARIVTWIERGPLTRAPECPHAVHCGGCALQHLTSETYADFKRQRVLDALRREGVAAEMVREPVLIAPATRRRAAFAAARRQRRLAFGFNARRSHEIVAIDECKILHPQLHRHLAMLRRLAEAVRAPAFDLQATLCDNGVDIDIRGPRVVEPSGDALTELIAAARGALRVSANGAQLFAAGKPIVTFDGIAVAPPPGAFLQASKEGESALIARVRDAAKGARRIADLFAGCGTFALPLGRAAQVAAFDSDKQAIGALNEAVKEFQRRGQGLKSTGEVRDLFESPLRASELDRYDAVVFDPPRAGALAQAGEIARSKIPVAIAVSCNPASFARDAAILIEGGYRLIEVTPVDQFVYSPHIELAAVFRRS